MRYARHILGLVMLAGMLMLVAAEPGYAAQGTASETGCREYAGLTSRIVACTRDTLANAMEKYFDKDSGFYPLVQRAIAGFLTLGVAIYGCMAAFGMLEKVGRDTMVLILKLSFITWAASNTPYLYNMSLDLMDASAAAVVKFVPDPNSPAAGEAGQAACLKNMKQVASDSRMPSVGPWLAIDCMIDSVIGIKMSPHIEGNSVAKASLGEWWNRNLDSSSASNGENSGMARGILYFFFSSMQSSIMGVMLAIVGFIFIYSMAFLLVKALLVYLGGYLGLSLMMLFAPLFIPLILFRQTKNYFDQWFKLTLSFALQPVIILVFVCFTMLAVDLAMFSGNYSVMYRIAGDASRQQQFSLNKYLEENEIVTRKPTVAAHIKADRVTPALTGKDEGGLFSGSVISECTNAIIGGRKEGTNAKEVCSNVLPLEWWRNSIDWGKMAQLRQPAVADPGPAANETTPSTPESRKAKQISGEVLASVIFVAITVFVMNGLLTVIPMMANDLVGDSFRSPNLYEMASKRAKGLDGIASSMGSGVGNLLGGNRGGRR